VVLRFGEHRGAFDKLAIIRPLHARPDLFAEFYFRESYRVGSDQDAYRAAPDSVLVGPTLRPGALLGAIGEIECFTISFTPTGMTRLLGIPAELVVDRAVALSDLVGKKLAPLEAGLRHARDFPARVSIAENFLGRMLQDASSYRPVDHAARLLARSNGRVSIDALATRVGLSARQLQRSFVKEVGVAPKFYGRLHRFASAIDARRSNAARSWADIALAHGYTDQAHLAREARLLADLTPNTLISALTEVGVSDFYNHR
jgi:AraC-like DNA-binding protein